VEWLLLLLVPVALLMFAHHALTLSILWRELKKAPRTLRAMSRRKRMATLSIFALAAIADVFLIRAFEGHGRQTVAYVLLAFCGVVAVLAVVVLPVLIYRSSRSRDKELMQ
jgi:hypothetical protein